MIQLEKTTNISFVLSVCLAFLFCVSFAMPQVAVAQSVFLASGNNRVAVGERFTARVIVNTLGQSINTVSGEVLVPLSLSVVEIRSGVSIIPLWVERPTFDESSRVIKFTGGIPGGFNGSAGELFSIVFRAKTSGNVTLLPRAVSVLLNDGAGTEAKNVSIKPLQLSIVAAPKAAPAAGAALPVVKKEVSLADKTAPESFTPLVSRHPLVADNRYFISFFAVDKDSGIDHYEVREEPFLISLFSNRFIRDWTRSETPYVLSIQWWASTVRVRAVDRAGNITEASAPKPFHPVLSGGALLLLIFFIFLDRLRRFRRQALRRVIIKR